MKRNIFSLILFAFILGLPLAGQNDPIKQAQLLVKNEDYQAASTILQRHLKIKEEDHQARLLYGQCLIKTNQHEQAISELKKIKKPLEQDSDFHFWFGQAYLGKLNASKNFFEKGIIASRVKEAFEKSVELNPENLTARNSLATYYLTAPGIAGGSTKKAKEQIDYIKSKDPRMGYYAMANYYFRKKEYDEAKTEYLNYLDIADDKSEVLYQIGFIAQTQKNYPEAFDYFNKSIQESKIFTPSYYQYARTAIFAETKIDEGIKMMKIFIDNGGSERGPDLASAHWRLGMLYELNGQKDLAKNIYLKALELDPNHEQANSALDNLEE